MVKVVGVRFGRATKVYYFDPTGFETLRAGDRVIVDTARGVEMGQVASAPGEVPDTEVVGKLKRVLRVAEPWDLVQAETFHAQEAEALAACRELVAQQRLPMKLVRAEYSFDGSRLTFHFTSDKRVDFRGLVRDLAKTFKTRIELRQIGVRDEAKLLGGLGCCGRPLCCDSWLCEFNPVSIKMAKQQDLPLNPMEISGVCGRLLCCLGYENDYYTEVKGRLPKVGRTITLPEGTGKVIGHNVFSEKVRVLLENEVVIEVAFADARESLERQQPARPAPKEEPPAVAEDEGPKESDAAKAKRSRKRRKRKKSGAGRGSGEAME